MKKILGINLSTGVVLLLLVLLNSCAKVPTASMIEEAKAKEFKTPPVGKSGIYVLRPSMLGTALKKDIWIDEKCLGESAVGVFFYSVVDANQTHKVSTESEFSPNDMSLFTKEGHNYFVEQYVRLGLFVGGAQLELMKETEGMRKVKELNMGVPGSCDNKYRE